MRLYIGVCRKSSTLFKIFDVVEIQETFYDIPQEKTVQGWAEKAGKCRLTFKAFQGLTHGPNSPTWRRYRKGLKPEEKPLVGELKVNDLTLTWIRLMAKFAKLMDSPVIVVQTPPRFGYSEENVGRAKEFFRAFEDALKAEGAGAVIGWEPRGSWLENLEGIERVIKSSGRVIHIVDPLFHRPVEFSDVAYFRLHGKPYLNYKYQYSKEDFSEILKAVKQAEAQGVREVYILFNNVKMVDDAKRFATFCQQAGL